MVKPEQFKEAMLLLTIYHDISGMGYQRMISYFNLGFRVSANSLDKNVHRIRRVLAMWGEETIRLGSLDDRRMAATDVDVPSELKGTSLWMDSSDFPLQKYAGWSSKNDDYSYKTKSPARRYLFLTDARGVVRQVWGGYSPKIFDGNATEFLSPWIEANLGGATVVADQHFDWA